MKWEYCLLTAMIHAPTSLTTYSEEGAMIERFPEDRPIDNNDVTVVAGKIIARLGIEGWELVSANSIAIVGIPPSTEMFFKRPKA